MNRLFIVISLYLAFATTGLAQSDFKWDKTGTTSKTAAEIYSATKLFIAETWKSSKDVIQNDDKEGGVILLKGTSVQNVPWLMSVSKLYYRYSVTFKMKDNKYKIMINNVYCDETNENLPKIQPFEGDNYVQVQTFTQTGLPKRKAVPMMANLKKELQEIVDSYEIFINKEVSKDDW